MLLCFLVVITINRGIGVVLNGVSKVFLDDELAPDLNYLLVEVLSLLHLAFLLENLSHIEVTAAEIDALWSIELALKIDGM